MRFIPSNSNVCGIFFFFQAEDGIRDRDVTGVQTCALPISVDGEADSEEFNRALELFLTLYEKNVCVDSRLFEDRKSVV